MCAVCVSPQVRGRDSAGRRLPRRRFQTIRRSQPVSTGSRSREIVSATRARRTSFNPARPTTTRWVSERSPSVPADDMLMTAMLSPHANRFSERSYYSRVNCAFFPSRRNYESPRLFIHRGSVTTAAVHLHEKITDHRREIIP